MNYDIYIYPELYSLKHLVSILMYIEETRKKIEQVKLFKKCSYEILCRYIRCYGFNFVQVKVFNFLIFYENLIAMRV